MKTIHKNSKASLNPERNFLVEDSAGHHLLPKKSTLSSSRDVSALIKLKEDKDKKNHFSNLLVSSISLCLSLLMVIGMFEWKSADNGSEVNLKLKTESFEDLLDIPQTEQIQKPPVKVQAPRIIEVNDEEIIEEIEINLDIEMTEDTRIEEVIFVNNEDAVPEENVDEIFTIVEEQPSPVGGMKSFYAYVSKNLVYPSSARRMGLEGRVFVEFVVEKDGSLTDINAVKGPGGGCNEEAVRVISEAPKWNPGKQRGREVRVRMVLPIVFKLL